jgi:hypothetical protein
VMSTVALVYFISAVFSNSETLLHVVSNGCNKMFNACIDPLFDVQVIYRALTRQLTTG